MACTCRGRSTNKYVWTSDPDENGQTDMVVYDSEIQAKAKVLRVGGSYKVKQG